MYAALLSISDSLGSGHTFVCFVSMMLSVERSAHLILTFGAPDNRGHWRPRVQCCAFFYKGLLIEPPSPPMQQK